MSLTGKKFEEPEVTMVDYFNLKPGEAQVLRDTEQHVRAEMEEAIAGKDQRIADLELALRKIHDRAHSWNNIPACSDIEQIAFDALGLKDGA